MSVGETGSPASELVKDAAEPMAVAVAIMQRLRGPDGCPWDREQTFDSIKRHTLEETYEVFDAIERRSWGDLKDELGDLLLQVLFYAQMASDAGYFTIADVARGLNAKLIRRHPHIFPAVEGLGAGRLADAAEENAVLRNWEQIKREERQTAAGGSAEGTAFRSGLEEIPRTMPAMLEAAKLGSTAAKVGFDWSDVQGLFVKLEEEAEELRAEVSVARVASPRVEEELADLLFTAVNLARHLDVDAESALRLSNAKFRKRFAVMEREVGGYDSLSKLNAEELEELWRTAKARERDSEHGEAG